MAGLAVLRVQRGETVVDLADDAVEHVLGNRGIAAVAVELLLVPFEVLEHVGLEIGAGSDVHDLEDGHQRVVVIERMGSRNQLAQAAEQLLEPQIGSQAFVERIFVKDHAAGFLGRSGRGGR